MTDTPNREERAGAEEETAKAPRTDNAKTIAQPSTDPTPEDLSPDTDEAIAFLEAYRPDGPWVLTAIEPDGGRTATVTFESATRDRLRAWIDARQGRNNLYFTVNDAFGPLSKKARKSDIRAARALHIDIDPRPGEPIAQERTRARDLLEGFEPKPTVIVDSGGGYQAFWLSGEPVLLDGPKEDQKGHQPIEDRNLAIETKLQADACHNIDRVMRLPGTINVPSEKKRRKGRVPTLAKIVFADWSQRYALDDFPLAELRKPSTEAQTVAPSQTVDVAALPVPERIKSLILNGRDLDDPGRYKSRSEAVFAVLCALARAGVSDEDGLAVLLDPKLLISAHVLESKKPETYALRQIARAREELDDSFDTDKEGRTLPNSQRNIRVALRKLDVAVRHDEFSGRNRVDGLDGFGPGLDDAALNRLGLMVDERFRFRPTKDFFLTVTADAARRNGFHPVVEYLAGLHWDGKLRLDTWLPEYGGADDNTFVGSVGALVLIAAVRRVRKPGVKFDEMLVLEGAQGTNKSSALKVLAVRDEWFTDDLPLNAKAQQVIEVLSGKWIVEAGELNGMRRGGIDQLKGFLSRSHDKARMAYDRLEREVARQCVIVGTTNDRRYLRETTGGRRFWPVAVQTFDLDALRRDRDQLWAEAATREAEGAPIRLDPTLYEDVATEQDARRVEDPFYERLHSALGEEFEGKLKTEDAWQIVGKQAGHRTQDDNARLGDAMRRLGFERTQRRFGGKPEYCYLRGDASRRIAPRFGPNGEVYDVTLTDGGPAEPF